MKEFNLEGYEYFSKFVLKIFEKSALQKKMITNFLLQQNNVYRERVEQYSEKMLSFLRKSNIPIDYVVGSYLKMCNDFLNEQIKFKKSGKYSIDTAFEAIEKVYTSQTEMSQYMYGLSLSLFLWPNHYAMYDFFIHESSKIQKNQVINYLEIGPGHGMFLLESMKLFPEADFYAIDISPISIDITEKMVRHFMPQANCVYINEDVNNLSDRERKYDYIVMCEVLEHLDDPLSVLLKASDLLSEDGKMFITTCANCPAIDHVYLYRNVKEIEKHFEDSGFEILIDLPLKVGDVKCQDIRCENIETNYAAILQKRK